MAKYTAQDRRDLAAKGHALPDGSFPIADDEDLKSAIRNWGLGNHPEQAKRHIVKRAKAMGSYNVLPEKWRDKLEHQAKNTEEFLAHYGIKGMRWGVTHTPDSSTGLIKPSAEEKAAAIQVKREGKAQKYEKRAANVQKTIDQIQSKTYNRFTQGSADKQVRELQQVKQQALRDANAKRNGKLSKGQKQVIIGAAIVGALVIGSVAYSQIESGDARATFTKGKAFVQGKSATDFKKKTELADKTLDADGIFSKVVKDINPGYGKPGTVNNCRRATFAYEMRRRGFDVQATKTNGGYGQNAAGLANALSPGKRLLKTGSASVVAESAREDFTKAKHRATPISDISKAFSGGGKTKIDGSAALGKPTGADILARLAKEPDGSRGELGVVWKSGGGHSMAYEVVKGKPVIFDTQAGKKITNLEEAVGHGLNVLNSAGFTRLDNIPLNEDYLLRWVKNVK